MKLQSAKALLVFLLTLVVGVGQVCACAGHNLPEQPSKVVSHHVHDGVSRHSESGIAHNKPCPQGDDCGHHDQPVLAASAFLIDGANLASSPVLQGAALLEVPALSYHTGFAPRVLDGVGWLNPPPQTPVTLKSRLLN